MSQSLHGCRCRWPTTVSECYGRLRCCIDSNFWRSVWRSAILCCAWTCSLALYWRITSSEISKSPPSSSEAYTQNCIVSQKLTLKGCRSCIAVNEIPSHSYGVSLAICDHTVFTCHPTQVNTPRLNPSQTGWNSIYLPRRNGRLSWPRWLVTYWYSLPAHPSKF